MNDRADSRHVGRIKWKQSASQKIRFLNEKFYNGSNSSRGFAFSNHHTKIYYHLRLIRFLIVFSATETVD